MIKKGDRVQFIIGNDSNLYIATSDEYKLRGRRVVNLKDYPGEVAVKYLKNTNHKGARSHGN